MRSGDLTGGECPSAGRGCALARQWEGGVDRPVEGHGAHDGGVYSCVAVSCVGWGWAWERQREGGGG